MFRRVAASRNQTLTSLAGQLAERAREGGGQDVKEKPVEPKKTAPVKPAPAERPPVFSTKRELTVEEAAREAARLLAEKGGGAELDNLTNQLIQKAREEPKEQK